MRLPSIDLRYPLAISAGLIGICGGLLIADGWRSKADLTNSSHLPMTDYSERALQKKLAGFDPAMAALARRFDPLGMGRATAASFDRVGDVTPDQFAVDDLVPLTPAQAFEINAATPVSNTPNPAARPFLLDVKPEAGARALDCLTAAVYYEAGYESATGQAAVAQVVLNRMRHPAFPKSVCGVVLQGADRRTGCQFTFTCDGALSRSPNLEAWTRARAVAAAALNGKVEKSVGNATHYHTVWVRPYWSSSLTKVRVIGAHIFYRWTGGWGLAPSFRGRYAGEAVDYAGLRALYAALQPLKLKGGVMVAEAATPSTPEAALTLINAPATFAPDAGGAAKAVAAVETVTVAPPSPPKLIRITGEVEHPGEYPWREGMTVEEAANAAGGFTYRAKTKEVFIRRAGDAAEAKIKGVMSALQPNDHVRIPERFF